MSRFSASLAVLLAMFAAPSLACHRITPDKLRVESYSAVFLGRVTGIHLVGYENSLIGEPDGNIAGVGGITITDGSATVVVTAVPLRVQHGSPGEVAQLQLVGCTAPLPKLKERGLFFVNPESGSAVTVWESDKKSFKYWLERLGLSADER